METEKMIYLVTEYAAGGEIFGKYNCNAYLQLYFYNRDVQNVFIVIVAFIKN